MKIKNTLIYVVCTLLISILTYYSAGVNGFIASGFIVSGIICGITGTINLYSGILSSIICLILSYISGDFGGVILYLFIVITGLIVGILIKNKFNIAKLIVINSSGYLISCVSYVAFASATSGTNVISSYLNNIKPEFVEMMNEYFLAMGLNDYTAVINEFVETYFIYVQNMIPSMFVITALLFSFISMIIASIIFKISGNGKLFRVKFSEFLCDKTTTIVFFISGVCSLFMKSGILQTVFMNIFVILLFVFQVCGFSLIDYFLKIKKLPLGVRVLILFICILFATSGILLFILIISAILDSFKNFRSIGVETDINDKGSE